MSTKLTINRTNGNVPKTLQGEDHITGFVAYLPDTETPASFKTERVQALSTIDAAEAAGITSDAASWAVRVLHFHLSEITAPILRSACMSASSPSRAVRVTHIHSRN